MLSLLRSIDIIIRTHLGSSSCAGAALTFLACLLFVEPIIPAMAASGERLHRGCTRHLNIPMDDITQVAMNMPMDDMKKAIVDQTEMNPELVQAVFDALVEIALAKVRKTDKKAIPTFLSLKLVEAKAGQRIMFLGMKAMKATTKAMKATTKAKKAAKMERMKDVKEVQVETEPVMKAMATKATKAMKAAPWCKAMTITEISDMYTEAASVAAQASGVLMAAAHMGSAACA